MLHPELSHLFPGVSVASRPHDLVAVLRESLRTGELLPRLTRQLSEFLAERSELDYEQLVVGLSGGVNSAVCAALAVRACEEHATGLIVRTDEHPDNEVDTATRLAEHIGIDHVVLDARRVLAEHLGIIGNAGVLSRIHLRSRLLTSTVFYFADNHQGLVIDTTDRSEAILRLYEEGYRGHVAPLIDLYKSEVYELSRQLGLEEVGFRPSGCPDLKNADAFGMEWEQLDAVLDALTVQGLSPSHLADMHGLDPAWTKALHRRIRTQPLRTDRVELVP